MAIKALSLSGSVAPGSRANFLSPPILRPHRPIAALLWTSVSATGSTYSVFLTRSDTPVPSPQPGDPPAFEILNMQTPHTNLVSIPLTTAQIIEPPVRFAFSFFNNSASAATVVATYIYEE